MLDYFLRRLDRVVIKMPLVLVSYLPYSEGRLLCKLDWMVVHEDFYPYLYQKKIIHKNRIVICTNIIESLRVIGLNHFSYVCWDFYPLVRDMVHFVDNPDGGISICINILDINGEPPLTSEGVHTSSVTLLFRVVMLSVVLLGRHELRTVEFILVLVSTNSLSGLMCMVTVNW